MPISTRKTTAATVTFSSPQEVIISHADDSIQVWGTDGVTDRQLRTDSQGRLIVVTGAVVGTVRSIFDEALAVPSGSPTTILSYTAPSATTFIRVNTGGTNIAQFEVYINGTLNARQRTYFGATLDTTFDYSAGSEGFVLNSGDLVEVKVTHQRPSSGDFEARLEVIES